MSPRAVRRLVLVVFVSGIAGMIVGSIADNNGATVTFGLLTATAAVGLILVTAVAGPQAFGRGPAPAAVDGTVAGDRGAGDPAGGADQALAAGEALEEQVSRLVAAGADERDVRELIRRAVAFGRQAR